MQIIGETKDLKSETFIIYAQVEPSEYLNIVGSDYGGFTIQRKRESHKAYGRLKDDIRVGASLPTITLALKPEYVDEAISVINDTTLLTEYLSQPGRCNILDGLQRTYILEDLKKEGHEFKNGQKLLVEIWLEKSLQKLIYRIIVLNAGQKPMSARHQIELLFASLQKAIEEEVGQVTLVTERDQKRRRRARVFPLQVIISGYQAFVSGATELNKDNLISQKLQVDTALDMGESEIQNQFSEFINYFKIYSNIDEHVFRIYSNVDGGDNDEDVVDDISRSNLISPHWLTNENTCISFFASIAQFAPHDNREISSEKRKRTRSALSNLLEILGGADVGADPLCLKDFEAIRMGKSARKINVGTYTRRLLSNGLKEFYRSEGEIALDVAWNLAAD